MISDVIKRLRNRETVQQLTTYCGKKVMQHFQLNKEAENICWKRYFLPTNGDKSKAILHNYDLSLKEVMRCYKKAIENK